MTPDYFEKAYTSSIDAKLTYVAINLYSIYILAEIW